ncbi:hypothetical protein BD414DRAFT_485695 [Trametes punicea]|nr:hypothetical protein BD414DRAFT_485695 [Trametes punicea]
MDLSIFSHDFSHLYSLDDVPPLDTFIPESLLPRDLFVHENRPRRIANGPRQRDTPMRYVRIYPTPGPVDRPSQNPVAHLYLDPNKNSLGKGNHSTVVRAPMVLRLDPDSRARSRVSVAVKLADNECGAHAMLRQEAKLYNSFPRHLMEDTVPSLCVRWNAVPAEASVPEVQEAVPAAKAAKCEEGGEGRESELVQAGVACAHKADEAQTTSQERSEPAMSSPPAVVQGERESGPVQHEDSISTANNDPPQPAESEKVQVLPAVVPKFYGYYAPLNPDGTPFSCEHEGCDVDSMCYVDWPTHVLLVEECGEPVHPYSVDTEDRRKCLDLFRRLHAAGFTQGSAYRRNMLIQPGPLSVPRDERTVDLPSFRLIDFGRGEARSMLDADVLDCFEGWAASELEQARRELRIS